ncbi:MAG: sulfatase-like hydrolase/transferase [Rhizobiaceae bacterium]
MKSKEVFESKMKEKHNEFSWAPTRRDFLAAAGLSALQLDLIFSSATSATAQVTPAIPAGKRGPNILLIVNDQERYINKLPEGYSLPGREHLEQLGTTFSIHQIASCVCPSSRSNTYTGQHITQTRMFDNVGFLWIKSLSTDIPTLGHMMRELGYYSTYQGKFHMNHDLEETQPKGAPPKLIGRKAMESNGCPEPLPDYTEKIWPGMCLDCSC